MTLNCHELLSHVWDDGNEWESPLSACDVISVVSCLTDDLELGVASARADEDLTVAFHVRAELCIKTSVEWITAVEHDRSHSDDNRGQSLSHTEFYRVQLRFGRAHDDPPRESDFDWD